MYISPRVSARLLVYGLRPSPDSRDQASSKVHTQLGGTLSMLEVWILSRGIHAYIITVDIMRRRHERRYYALNVQYHLSFRRSYSTSNRDKINLSCPSRRFEYSNCWILLKDHSLLSIALPDEMFHDVEAQVMLAVPQFERVTNGEYVGFPFLCDTVTQVDT